jgi:signal transduction histidine kinase
VVGQVAHQKNKMEEPKMRTSLKRMIVVLAAVALLGTGSVFASPPAPSPGASDTDDLANLSERASTLLAEIQSETSELGLHAETLGTFARNSQHSWQSHVFHLNRVKSHINAVGERTAELQQIRYAVLPWQERAITEVTSHAAQVAASAQAAIVYLNENQGHHFVPEYRDHLTTIADSSEAMKKTVDKFLDYEKIQQSFQQLQNELELGG